MGLEGGGGGVLYFVIVAFPAYVLMFLIEFCSFIYCD